MTLAEIIVRRLDAILADADLTARHRAVLIVLARHADAAGIAWPSYSTLGEQAGLGGATPGSAKRAAIRVLQQLEQLRRVEVVTLQGGRRAYRLRLQEGGVALAAGVPTTPQRCHSVTGGCQGDTPAGVTASPGGVTTSPEGCQGDTGEGVTVSPMGVTVSPPSKELRQTSSSADGGRASEEEGADHQAPAPPPAPPPPPDPSDRRHWPLSHPEILGVSGWRDRERTLAGLQRAGLQTLWDVAAYDRGAVAALTGLNNAGILAVIEGRLTGAGLHWASRRPAPPPPSAVEDAPAAPPAQKLPPPWEERGPFGMPAYIEDSYDARDWVISNRFQLTRMWARIQEAGGSWAELGSWLVPQIRTEDGRDMVVVACQADGLGARRAG